MVRLNVLSAVLVLYFAACLTPVSADMVDYIFNGTLQGETIITGGGGFCEFSPCPSAQGLPLNFSLPQFNPSLGSLQDVLLEVETVQGGTATITNFPLDCPQGGCHNDGGVDFNVGLIGSFSTGGSTFPLNFGGLQEVSVIATIGSDGGTQIEGFSTFPGAQPAFFPPDSDPFVGTGLVNFTVGSVLDINGYTADVLNLSVDPSNLRATVEYEYDPVVPEPSLFALTGGMFGLLAVWQVRRRTSRFRS